MRLSYGRELGRGNFGRVVWARDDALARDVAVKFLDHPAIDVDAILSEARALKEAKHPNVVEVLDVDFYLGAPAIVTEYLHQGSVEKAFGGQPGDVRRVLSVGIDACRGLAHAFHHDLLHRDVKPANLLIGDNGEIKLSDFGLACDANAPTRGPSYGYQLHLPPEALGDGYISTHVGDVYGMGLTLFRLFNGEDALDFAVETPQEFSALVKSGQIASNEQWLPHVPSRVRRVVNAAKHPDPGRRLKNADALRHKLEQALPVVSFRPLTDLMWEGTSTNGDVWELEVVNLPRLSEFELRARLARAGRTFRGRGDLTSRHLAARDAVKAAAKIMNDVAYDTL